MRLSILGKMPVLVGILIAGLISACSESENSPQPHASVGNSKITEQGEEGKSSLFPVIWTPSEIALLDTLSIRHLPAYRIDPSNRYQFDKAAISLGAKLFFDQRLSQTGTISCAVCHQPDRAFSDGMPVARGIQPGTRNTPSLLGVSHQQWLFWDGRKDSVWAQALEPFENPDEHNLSRVSLIHKIFALDDYRQQYADIFDDAPGAEALASWPAEASPSGDLENLKRWKSLAIEERKRINRIFANIGKALAAYESTLQFPVSRFDQFLEDLGQPEQSAVKPVVLNTREQQGLKLFIGKGACISCHHSPLLSNQQFQNIATGIPGKDMGRSQVAEVQRWDAFNCLGEYSDAPAEACKALKYMNSRRHDLSGSFKVPSLRNVSKTGPYMHDGRFQSLQQVVAYYANPPSQKQTDHHLPPIQLDETEQALLTEFLNTL